MSTTRYRRLTDRGAVLKAIEEYDRLGKVKFLDKYGYGSAKNYYLSYRKKLYDSKAIVGVAYGYQFKKPLKWTEFGGGKNTVMPKLKELGFNVIIRNKGVLNPINVLKKPAKKKK